MSDSLFSSLPGGEIFKNPPPRPLPLGHIHSSLGFTVTAAEKSLVTETGKREKETENLFMGKVPTESSRGLLQSMMLPFLFEPKVRRP